MKPYTNKSKKNNKDLFFKKNYESFSVFYNIHRIEIYKKIISVFHEFSETTNESISFKLTAMINGYEWNTEFKFKRNEYQILKDDLIPYFEECEDYETCLEIKNLYTRFNDPI
jgi:hypothetical protein